MYRWLKNLIGRCRSATRSETIVPRWEQDYHLQPIGKLGLFYEYLEMGKPSNHFISCCPVIYWIKVCLTDYVKQLIQNRGKEKEENVCVPHVHVCMPTHMDA